MATNENAQPPTAWRYCGNQIKRWREHAQVGREELAEEVGYSAEYVKSMEQGRRRPTVRLLQVADQMCRAHGLLRAAEEFLDPEKFALYSLEYMQYEADAIALGFYQALLIPGLLQTERYARELIGDRWPPLDEETVEQRVAFRMARQALLDMESRTFSFVIHENVLRDAVIDKEDHREQLRHLVAVGERRNVLLQVLLKGGGPHPGIQGPFVTLETEEHGRFAYEEGQMMGVLYSEPDKVSIVFQRYARLLQQALSAEESARFIKGLAEEL
ncbi:helix-turn-helix domain-containing protein [Streptomyces paromomycinus]|nr:helix-turn-helix transcriptional regulator [Streptomyces paromomycinus]